jgi:hypothetical protein
MIIFLSTANQKNRLGIVFLIAYTFYKQAI